MKIVKVKIFLYLYKYITITVWLKKWNKKKIVKNYSIKN